MAAKGPAPPPDQVLRVAAVLAAMAIIGVAVFLDVAYDGTMEPTTIGLLTGVVGPVVLALVIKSGGNGGSK